MTKHRLEAFSDGVIAIIITIMVLEIKVPHGQDFQALKPLLPIVLSYVLSFIYLAIYWNNHHHMFHTIERVSGSILWANMHLLFWLSLIPFTTGWMGENHFEAAPMALYGVVLFMSAVAYTILQRTLIAKHDHHNLLARAVGKDLKGYASLALYLVAVPSAFIHPIISGCIYIFVALMWLIPDKRIERTLEKDEV
ncbi:TMEM175 family protein [Adhaeribacter terreus]|uniref:TMEM175 family protein n=1 Tax=Adhaeribacter terreus TaxID=529703 RepID=A0ABW0E9B9_9BACT